MISKDRKMNLQEFVETNIPVMSTNQYLLACSTGVVVAPIPATGPDAWKRWKKWRRLYRWLCEVEKEHGARTRIDYFGQVCSVEYLRELLGIVVRMGPRNQDEWAYVQAYRHHLCQQKIDGQLSARGDLETNLVEHERELREMTCVVETMRKTLAKDTQQYLSSLYEGMTAQDEKLMHRLLTPVQDIVSATHYKRKKTAKGEIVVKYKKPTERTRLKRQCELAKEYKITPAAMSKRISRFRSRCPEAWRFIEQKKNSYAEAFKEECAVDLLQKRMSDYEKENADGSVYLDPHVARAESDYVQFTHDKFQLKHGKD